MVALPLREIGTDLLVSAAVAFASAPSNSESSRFVSDTPSRDPSPLVQATAQELAERGYGTLEEITVAREDVHFRLPREVARA